MTKLPYDIDGPYTRPPRLTLFQKLWLALVAAAFVAICVMAIFN